jgi:hypothetical protein
MLIRKEFKVHIRHDPPKQITAGSGGEMSEPKITGEEDFEPLQHSRVFGGNPPMIVDVCSYEHAKAIIEDLKADRDALLDALIELRDDTPPASSSLRKKIEAVITSVEQHQTRRLGSW